VELRAIRIFSEASSLKQPLKNAIVNMVEIYHFFRYNQNKVRRVKNASYNDNHWKSVTDTNNHFKKNIYATVDLLTLINVRNLEYFIIIYPSILNFEKKIILP
jgi:hypothetical protein